MKAKKAYLLEILIGVSVILLINVMWFRDNMGFMGVSPNPYWLIVIFTAARYGSAQGLLAGISCAVVYLFSVSYNVLFAEGSTIQQLPYKEIQLAALFIFFGFLIGEERRRVNSMLEKRQKDHNRLKNEFANLAMENMANKNINLELEGRILGQADTVNTLYEIARSLASLKVDDLYASIVGVVNKVIGPERCSLYIWETNM